jgi:N-methylhydantoinase A
VPASARFRHEFNRLHLRRYNYADESRPVEIVNLRVKAIGLTEKPALPELEKQGKPLSRAMLDERWMIFDNQKHKARIYDRQSLEPGHEFDGPAVIVDYESTAVLPPGWRVKVDKFGHLIMRLKRRK